VRTGEVPVPTPSVRGRGAADPRLWGRAGEPRDARLWRRMLAIRRFEQTLLRLFDEGALTGTTHCCIGQEADAVAVVEHLRPGDHLFSNHRCHGHYLAWTGDAVGLFAEVMGRRSGVCGGIGGSQHLCAQGFKSNGILGGTVPPAAGIALAQQLRGESGISVVFLGDGTLGEGVVYETMNIAALWRLPLWLVVEDNGWSQSTPVAANLAGSMRARFEAFGVPVREVSSTDVTELDAVAAEEASALRRDRAPRVLLIHTYRLCHHSKNDDDRPKAEVEARWATEPLAVHGARLGEDARARVAAEVEEGLAEALAVATSLP
jgi:acetoin:2,6-dichlorophenolindophenol oxidoreductase subunit alpha